jgi:nitroreductase
MQALHQATSLPADFDEAARAAIYRAIFTRRDIRSGFLKDLVPDETLARILLAAHHAPSVGFMQPWNFIVIRDLKKKAQIRDLVMKARGEEVRHIDEKRQELYRSLKLEGICEAPVNLCVTCDRTRAEKSSSPCSAFRLMWCRLPIFVSGVWPTSRERLSSRAKAGARGSASPISLRARPGQVTARNASRRLSQIFNATGEWGG